MNLYKVTTMMNAANGIYHVVAKDIVGAISIVTKKIREENSVYTVENIIMVELINSPVLGV